ncbi:hypothetical protein EYZ11_007053 [Aspergillus tanneri]|uniref:Uncharacterized protein n=1 Tax=Aspergillus tanneri TaxID=1220188 RepID=A0A4S3JGB3_9EURO|nr:hypothetical protein EYZ11_007053 [Aspergillus tanneri]
MGGFLHGAHKTLWEVSMMQIMNAITDKPDWDRKIFEESITAKWRMEVLGSSNEITPKMMDWVLDELRYKSELFQKEGIISAFDGDIVKSDTVISEELKKALKMAVRPLENIPDEQKDYHPGSNKQVVDLLHPSLFPLVYGRSRILQDSVVGLDDFLARSGNGEVLAVPPASTSKRYARYATQVEKIPLYSQKFQWLPCNVKFDPSSNKCHIVSYINNLRPDKHRDLYRVIEEIISRAIPLWNMTLTPLFHNEVRPNRVEFTSVKYLPGTTPDPQEPEQEDGETDEDFDNRYDDYRERYLDLIATRTVAPPEIGAFDPSFFSGQEPFDLQSKFCENGLQVIVKLANIELTPEKPKYNGGSWHVEGQLPSSLEFRQRLENDDLDGDISYEQDHKSWLKQVFGCDNEGPVTQDLGKVSCREGRIITFPNILQHRVSPFQLAEPSRPGHRKIIALFLVDPHIRIISTANVPPQRADWWEGTLDVRKDLLSRRLPVELQKMVLQQMDNFPITMDEAKELRLELMEERSVFSTAQNDEFNDGDFGLCEH